jgi:hypothetical protein
MRAAVYNSAIPTFIANPVDRRPHLAAPLRVISRIFFVALLCTAAAYAADWSGPEQQLAQKIVAVTGPGAVALTLENHSSLSRRENEIVQNGLRAALGQLGIRFVAADQAAAAVTIVLSENSSAYVWVAEIRQGANDAAVVMISAPRSTGTTATNDAVPLSLRKIPLWSQVDPILDVAVLEENTAPTHIAVLDAEKVSLYREQGGKWQQEQVLNIVPMRPWPRDVRGRVIPARDHLLDVYLPGVSCRTAGVPMVLNCRDSDDPWPLTTGMSGAAAGPPMRAFFAPTRNFFTGVLTPGVGKFTNVSKFYSAAALPRDKYTLWLFAATDGQVHMVDGMNEQTARLAWGSDLAGLKTACGSGGQILATSSSNQADSLRAYEFPDRDAVAVSAALEFAGAITALWTEEKGDSAIAVVKNRGTGVYESFRVALACGQ